MPTDIVFEPYEIVMSRSNPVGSAGSNKEEIVRN
jgi:hypothetical protein